ncbi:MAG: HPr family phosphocarrier protein [Lachnospiraceae bacterium]|nr:HPr family phosphocarrier protein [Lachnospiraceae bacterium]
MEIMLIKLNTIDDVKEFVNICSKYEADVDVKQGKFTVDGKSILGIFSLNLIEGLSVYILTPDEKVAEDFKRKIFKWNVS